MLFFLVLVQNSCFLLCIQTEIHFLPHNLHLENYFSSPSVLLSLFLNSFSKFLYSIEFYNSNASYYNFFFLIHVLYVLVLFTCIVSETILYTTIRSAKNLADGAKKCYYNYTTFNIYIHYVVPFVSFYSFKFKAFRDAFY